MILRSFKIINYRKFEVPNKFIEAAKLSKELIAKRKKLLSGRFSSKTF